VLSRALDRLIIFLAVIAGIYLVVIMFGIVFQATARSLGYSGSSHIFTFTEYGLLYIAMLASPWLVKQRGHVYIEILTAAAPDRWRIRISRLVAVSCVLVCLVLTWYAGEATWKAYVRGDADMRSLDMPRWLLLISVPLCFSLMAIEFSRFAFGREVMHTGEAGVHE
jgi:TRAP-type C4-dicarboxylate transport system permease small subunit